MKNPLVVVLLVAIASLAPAQTASGGRLDLSAWSGNSPVALNGTWDFWYEVRPGVRAPEQQQVPGTWAASGRSTNGWGIYRLTVLLPSQLPGELGLSVPMVGSAGEVLWNGQVVWKAGEWLPAQYHPEKRPGVARLTPVPGENLLEVRVSSYGDLNPGLFEPLVLGQQLTLLKQRNDDILVAVALFCSLFVMGIYHFGLFAFRPQDRAPLWFGILAILFSLRGLLYGSTYLAELAPWLDWEPTMKLWYWSFSASALCFALFIAEVFPQQTPKGFRWGALAGGGGYSLLILVAPAAVYTPLLPYFSLYVGAIGALVTWILIRAVGTRETGSGLFLAGFVVLFATAVNDMLKSNFLLPTPFLGASGLVAFLVFQSLVMIKKFSVAFANSETYGAHLSRINLSLERFIPKEVLSYLQRDSILEIKLGDFSEHSMAVMFADIRDFTSLSETMTPHENFQFINSYLGRMGPVVRRHNGFVDKYMGDGIMALFPGKPEDALRAALAMREALMEYNGHRKQTGYQEIRMGIGVHRGPLMLGTIGENRRMDSTVISDAVNTASRLEGLTKKLTVDLLVSEETISALSDSVRSEFRFAFLSEETVKGRKQPLRVYTISGA